jgi:hypothetical protein
MIASTTIYLPGRSTTLFAWEVEVARSRAITNRVTSSPARPRVRRDHESGDTLPVVTDLLIALRESLEEAAARLRSGQLDPEAALAVIEECARLAAEASAQVDERARAALEPLPDLPGQLPLPAG